MNKNIVLPDFMSCQLAELIGAHYGDGSLYVDKKYNYNICYFGNLISDKEYSDYLYNLIYTLFEVKFKRIIDKKRNCITLRLRSKKLFYYYKDILNIPSGPKNGLKIPPYILKNDDYLINFLRGLFDTDGCITLQRDGKYRYLILKISMKSKCFAESVRDALLSLKIPCYICKKNRYMQKVIGFDVVARNKNVNLFFEIIGSNNPRNKLKFGDAGTIR